MSDEMPPRMRAAGQPDETPKTLEELAAFLRLERNAHYDRVSRRGKTYKMGKCDAYHEALVVVNEMMKEQGVKPVVLRGPVDVPSGTVIMEYTFPEMSEKPGSSRLVINPYESLMAALKEPMVCKPGQRVRVSIVDAEAPSSVEGNP